MPSIAQRPRDDHVIAELSELRDVHTQAATHIENPFGTKLDVLSDQSEATILPPPPDVTGMAKSNRLGCRGSCQFWRSLANFARCAQAPENRA